MSAWSIDFETRARDDIKLGLCRYLQTAEALWLCGTNGDAVFRSDLLQSPPPQVLVDHIAAGGIVSGWNVMFEYYVWNKVLPRTYRDLPVLRIEQLRDTMAQAAACALPQQLGACAEALGTDLKDAEGKKLIQLFSKPASDGRYRNPADYPDRWQSFGDYCLQDVYAESAIAYRLPALSRSEQLVWEQTQQINERGIPIDINGLKNVKKIIEQEKLSIDASIKLATDYAVTSVSEQAKLLLWLKERGYPFGDLKKDSVAAALNDVEDDAVRAVLLLRQHGSKTSVAKVTKLLEIVCEDGLVRGALTYHGAATGRFASRGGLNVQNFKRPVVDEKEAVAVLADSDYDYAKWHYGGDLMDAASSVVRGMIKAPDGYTLIDADFSSIENRLGAWLSEDDNALEAFRQGLDQYKDFAATMFGIGYDAVNKEQRQVGKAACLGAIYGQGARGFINYASGYGVTLSREESKVVIDAYRDKYNKTVQLWDGCDKAAKKAINNPGTVCGANRLKFHCEDNFLVMTLPSHREIRFYDAKVTLEKTPWGEERPTITHLGVNSVTKKWERMKLIGSSIFQSAVQGLARDLLVYAAFNVERAGYPIVFHVHDELISCIPENSGSVAEFCRAMTRLPLWADGLPLTAEGYEAKRFRK